VNRSRLSFCSPSSAEPFSRFPNKVDSPQSFGSYRRPKNIKCFAGSQSSAAAILYPSGLLFLPRSRSPDLFQSDTARQGRLTLAAGPAQSDVSPPDAQPRYPLNQNLTRSCPCSEEHLKYTGKMQSEDASLGIEGKGMRSLGF